MAGDVLLVLDETQARAEYEYYRSNTWSFGLPKRAF